MKKNLLLSLLSLIVVLSLATYSAFAWFKVGVTEFRNVIFTAGNMSVSSYFWMIQDNNRDGYYDYDDSNNLILIDTMNMLTGAENIITPQLAVEGDVFSYRILIKSTSDIPVALTIRLDNLLSPINNIISWNYSGYKRYQSLLFSDINDITEFSDLDDPAAYDKIFVDQEQSIIYKSQTIVAKTKQIIMYPQDIFVFDFQVRFESLDWLKQVNPAQFNDLTDLSQYSSANFNDTTIYIEFVSI